MRRDEFGAAGNCELGSMIHTDDLQAYKGLANIGYQHDSTNVSAGNDPAHVAPPAVHRVASLLKRPAPTTAAGARNTSRRIWTSSSSASTGANQTQGLLFYRLLQNAVALRKIIQEVVVLRPKPEGTKRRGCKRTQTYVTTAITNTQRPRQQRTQAAP